MKLATLEEAEFVTRALEDFVSANTLRVFEILGLPRDVLFTVDRVNWVHDEGY